MPSLNPERIGGYSLKPLVFDEDAAVRRAERHGARCGARATN